MLGIKVKHVAILRVAVYECLQNNGLFAHLNNYLHSYASSMLIYYSVYMSDSISGLKWLKNGFIYTTKDDV